MIPLQPFLISVAAFCGLSVLLAILTVIADATVGNYGDITITINNDAKMVAAGGRPLLGTLSEQKLFIPSACGGRGSCGLCKVKVESDLGEYLPTELPWISEEERKENIRLSCQIKAKKDLAIRIPEELFNVKEYRTRALSIRDLTHDIKEVTLQLVDPPEISIKAGQYVQFEVPEYELTPERVYRAYSVSSPPSRKDIVELEIRLVPNGICTTFVFTHLKEGDEVTINGPYGDFHLRDTERDIVFIAGGSGMAPIKSILLDMVEKGIDRKAVYFFGAQSKRDLFLVDEMRELERKLPNFRFVPALSRPLPEDEWQGESGLITEVLNRHLTSGENVEAYLCGSPGMIDASIKVLTAKGIPEDLIYYDKFA
jgi:Na+-transporting NADH:ubiquinone oxidoreductase subunit F